MWTLQSCNWTKTSFISWLQYLWLNWRCLRLTTTESFQCSEIQYYLSTTTLYSTTVDTPTVSYACCCRKHCWCNKTLDKLTIKSCLWNMCMLFVSAILIKNSVYDNICSKTLTNSFSITNDHWEFEIPVQPSSARRLGCQRVVNLRSTRYLKVIWRYDRQ